MPRGRPRNPNIFRIPKNKHEPQYFTFGTAGPMNDFAPSIPRDDKRTIGNELAKFLIHYAHQVVYSYGGLPKDKFEPASYHGVLLKKCTDERISKYISDAERTLARWITYKRLKKFSVILLDNNELEATGEPISRWPQKVAEFQVCFYKPTIWLGEVIYNFKKIFADLQRQLKKILMDMHAANAKREFNIKDLRLKIMCQLTENTDVVRRKDEHFWILGKPIIEFQRCPVIDINPYMTNKLGFSAFDIVNMKLFNFVSRNENSKSHNDNPEDLDKEHKSHEEGETEPMDLGSSQSDEDMHDLSPMEHIPTHEHFKSF
ncbi:hypothetical protein Ddc_09748 [Ditylenchus destructor]|nr:hypothetical protein Ddc_09748 [Ditylenchus destructor]